MKKVVLSCLVAVATFFMVSCNKDVDLSGTSWTSSYTMNDTLEGMSANIKMDILLSFTDNVKGTLIGKTSVTIGGVPVESDSDTAAFTYTFDGKTAGALTNVDEEDSTTTTYNFTYSKDNKTITVATGETEEGFPSQLVFTKKN